MKIHKNIILKPFTSMHVGGPALYFAEAKSVEDVTEAILCARKKELPHFILGHGSNTLFSDKGFNGLIIKMGILGKKILSETDKYIEYELGAGETWDNFVKFAVNNNLYGVENLSHVPGTVGASVVQNIGCYGQEVSTSVVSVRVIRVEDLKTVVIPKKQIHFSYRKSRFNDSKADKDKYIITSVAFRLKKQGKINMNYNDIKKYFDFNKKIKPNLKNLRKAIITVRDTKFPFPNSPKNGTCGSFWNAEPISEKKYNHIIKKLQSKGFEKKAQEMIDKKSVFMVAQGFKVPYGVLVEVLGFKGKKFNKAKILETHSCIINNFTGKATAKEIQSISNAVINSVYKEFGVKMKVEPELVGDF